MPHGEYAVCPQCGATAIGHDEIEEIFGYRYGGTKPQSWCRDCRSSSSSSREEINDFCRSCGDSDEWPECKSYCGMFQDD